MRCRATARVASVVAELRDQFDAWLFTKRVWLRFWLNVGRAIWKESNSG